MELASNCHYKIVSVVCKLYLLGFLKHSMAFNFFFLYSICHQNEKKFAQYSLSAGRFSRPLPYKPPPPPPLLYLVILAGMWCILSWKIQTNKQ